MRRATGPRRVSLGGFLGLLPALLLSGTLVAGCSSAPKTPPENRQVRDRAAEYAIIGNNYFQQANYEMALQFFELALSENTVVDHLPGVVQSRNSIAKVYLAAGRYRAAQSQLDLALELAQNLEDQERLAKTHTLLGELAMHQGDNQGALNSLTTARDILIRADAPVDPVLLHNLGTVHARLEEYFAAQEFLSEALEANLEEDSWANAAGNYYMLSSVASRREEYDRALELMEQALSYDKRAENSIGIAADLEGIGAIHERRNNPEEAYPVYLRALRIYVGLGLAESAAETLAALERLALTLGRDEEAAEFAIQRERILQETATASEQ